MAAIAGHTFVNSAGGRVCSGCGRTWLSVVEQREYWRPGEKGIAHSGALTEMEVAQLNAEVERIWSAVTGVEAPPPAEVKDWVNF